MTTAACSPATSHPFKGKRKESVSLDVVIPIFNEAQTLPLLLDRIERTFSKKNLSRFDVSQVTILLVDDGSADGSADIIRRAASHTVSIRLIRLSRNFGHQAAVSAGIANSDADLTAVIDGDLQDPPEIILDMVDQWRQGHDVVYAQRGHRKENVVKRFFYWGFYRIYKILSPIDVPTDSGDFCLMDRRVVQEIVKLPESIRFFRGLRSWVGFRQIPIAYDRPRRAAGKSKYSFWKLYQLATDGITALSTRPLRIAQFMAVLYVLFSFLVLLALIVGILTTETDFNREFMILLAVICLSNGITMTCLYIIGAYVGRAYLEGKQRPNHIIEEIIDVD